MKNKKKSIGTWHKIFRTVCVSGREAMVACCFPSNLTCKLTQKCSSNHDHQTSINFYHSMHTKQEDIQSISVTLVRQGFFGKSI